MADTPVPGGSLIYVPTPGPRRSRGTLALWNYGQVGQLAGHMVGGAIQLVASINALRLYRERYNMTRGLLPIANLVIFMRVVSEMTLILVQSSKQKTTVLNFT